MNLDELATAIEASLPEPVRPEFAFERLELGETPRLRITRALATEKRYLHIAAIDDPGASWEFSVLGGRYGHQDPRRNFDARQGGSASEVMQLLRRWLVELGHWEVSANTSRF